MKNRFLVFSVLFFVLIFFGYYYSNQFFQKNNLQLIELKTFENTPVATTSPHNIALYSKYFLDDKGKGQTLFVALGTMQSDEAVVREGLTKLHTNDFWDPNRCAQMLNIIGREDIIFSDTFKDVEGDGFTTFIYKYNIKTNTLIAYKVFLPIQKLFGDGLNFFAISKNNERWQLYKIDFENFNLKIEKEYDHNLDLITAVEDLKWCDIDSVNCVTENNYHFIKNKNLLKQEIDPENSLNVKIFFENKKIFELFAKDLIGYYVLGIRPQEE